MRKEIYITSMASRRPHFEQMSLDDLLFGGAAPSESFSYSFRDDRSDTRTYRTVYPSFALVKAANVPQLLESLRLFTSKYEHLYEQERSSLYHTYYIPKHSGGTRRIDEPNEELMKALRELKQIFEDDFGALYHTSAFAYIKHRCTLDAVKRHQANESKWFAKFDLHNFFGSTTPEFVMDMFSRVFPFSEVCDLTYGKGLLQKALDLAFLNGGLPQGTPVSPTITNIMMIPIDHTLSNHLRDFGENHLIYTRYADDFIISSRHTFSCMEVQKYIIETLKGFSAPFSVNEKKTRYGSSAGRNWNLGVMLNKDNEITIGYQKKKQFQAMLTSYVLDKKNGKPWDISDVRVMDGLRSYYRMVEGEKIDCIVEKIGAKFGADIPALIRQDLA